MNNKQKFGYTILGAVIMLIGIGVGAIVSPSLTAQRNGVFGEIECTELTVVDTAGNPVVVLGASEQLMSSGTTPVRVKRNGVLVLDPSGKDAVFLSANEGMNSSICPIISRGRKGKKQFSYSPVNFSEMA